MKNQKEEKSKIDDNDSWNRSFYGTPTFFSIMFIILVAAYIIYDIWFK